MQSGLTEHFKEYMVNFEINEESVYRFTIKNYTTAEKIDWVDYPTGTYGTTADDHAYIELTGKQLKSVIDISDPTPVPYIKVDDTALITESFDVLVEVTETCKKLNKSEYGYYFVVFKALDLKVELYNVKLGTFKEVNDFVLAHELVESIKDANGKAIFKWDSGTKKWTSTEDAKVYGIMDATKLKIDVTKLTFAYDTEESFGENLFVCKPGETLNPVGYTPTESGINWWNLGTDLQKDKKAKFTVDLKWDGKSLAGAEGEVIVLATENSNHPLHKADGSIMDPVVYKDGWFYATK